MSTQKVEPLIAPAPWAEGLAPASRPYTDSKAKSPMMTVVKFFVAAAISFGAHTAVGMIAVASLLVGAVLTMGGKDYGLPANLALFLGQAIGPAILLADLLLVIILVWRRKFAYVAGVLLGVAGLVAGIVILGLIFFWPTLGAR
jgi:hypothetical protein